MKAKIRRADHRYPPRRVSRPPYAWRPGGASPPPGIRKKSAVSCESALNYVEILLNQKRYLPEAETLGVFSRREGPIHMTIDPNFTTGSQIGGDMPQEFRGVVHVIQHIKHGGLGNSGSRGRLREPAAGL